MFRFITTKLRNKNLPCIRESLIFGGCKKTDKITPKICFSENYKKFLMLIIVKKHVIFLLIFLIKWQNKMLKHLKIYQNSFTKRRFDIKNGKPLVDFILKGLLMMLFL